MEEKLTRTQTDLQEALAAKGKPFEHAEELAEKSARLEQLNRELEVGHADEVILNESEDEVQDIETRFSPTKRSRQQPTNSPLNTETLIYLCPVDLFDGTDYYREKVLY